MSQATNQSPHYVSGFWIPSAGQPLTSINPATGGQVWSGASATSAEVDLAFAAARGAQRAWEGLGIAAREAPLRAFAALLGERREWLAEAISLEAGKPAWEALTEVQSMIGKVELSVKAQAQRCSEFSGGGATTRFRAHGVCAVLGPFNFPGHLPNGHIVPALLAGNTVVFKPSERTPLVAERTVRLWAEAGLPAGVLNLVQGCGETGGLVASHRLVDGLFFTGSARVGLRLHAQFASQPQRILALEMGGNNPLVAWTPLETEAAALIIVQSAFQTAGQRCTCARRLIVPAGPEGDALLGAVLRRTAALRVGSWSDRPEPFCGPVISARAALEVLETQRHWIAAGGIALRAAELLKPGTGLLAPGVIDVTAIAHRSDEEVFGPLLQVVRVNRFEEALREASATRFGLAAGLLGGGSEHWERFRSEVRAGVLNWNTPLTGASGAAPFGGTGLSGNHRPSAYFAADYCNRAVASMETPTLALPQKLPPGLGD